MPDQYSLDSPSLDVPSSKTSLNVSEEEYDSSLSEDECHHRSYTASQPSLYTPAPARQKSRLYKSKLFRTILRLGRKREKEFEGIQIQDSSSDMSGTTDEKTRDSEQLSETNRTDTSQPNLDAPKEDKATEIIKPNGIQPHTKQELKENLAKDNNVRDTLKLNQERIRKLSAGSNGSFDYSQTSSRPSLSGSRVFISGTSAETAGRRKVNVILLGDPGVGKSTFLQTLATGKYVPSSKMSNILSAHTSLVLTHSGQDVELEVQDTAGQERFRSLTASYYRHAHGCFVFFNVHDRDSFASVSNWLEDIQMYHSNTMTPAVVLVGLLHRPPKDRGSFRRRSSLRGDDINSVNSPGSSPRDNNHHLCDTSSDRRGSAHDVHKHQQHQNEHQHQHHHHSHHSPHQLHQHHLTIPTIIVEHTSDEFLREVPQPQAEHMAANWEIPYVEVDAKFDNDSVLSAVETLLDLVLPDLAHMTRSRLTSIVPSSSKRNSSDLSLNSIDMVHSFTCCLHC